MVDAVDERILILRCQMGDERAFEEIVGRYQRRLTYFLGKLLGRGGAADDVLQDVWLDVIRGIPKLRNAAAFRAWLYRIARDRAFRSLRRRSIEDTVTSNVDPPSNEDREFTAEDAQSIHRGLDDLSPEHREVLLLRFIEDLTYEEIASVVQCEMGTVKSRLHYAKNALRRIIEREPIE